MAEELSNGTVPLASREAQYYGVDGWLLVFCISLTILSPLVNLPALSRSLVNNANLASTHPLLHFFIVVKVWVTGTLVFIGIVVGFWLWTLRPRALHYARVFLFGWLIWAPTLFVFPLLSGLTGDARQIYLEETLKHAARLLPYPIIRLLYLAKSRRVAATYSTNE